jgi:hypothetical protein
LAKGMKGKSSPPEKKKKKKKRKRVKEMNGEQY